MTISLARAESMPEQSHPTSPSIMSGEYVTRFPAESLHSFSFSQKTEEYGHTRQNMIKRSMDFMNNNKMGGFMAGGGFNLASAQAKVAGDLEVQSILEALSKTVVSPRLQTQTGLGLTMGAATGPATTSNENVFERDFVQSPTIIEQSEDSGEEQRNKSQHDLSLSTSRLQPPEVAIQAPSPQKLSEPDSFGSAPQRGFLKRTYTDIDSVLLRNKLADVLEQPYITSETDLSSTSPIPSSAAFSPPLTGAFPTFAPHAHGRAAPNTQAIFTTTSEAPWTLNAANDLACLIFGITKAELRKIGILEMVRENKRAWLEKKLTTVQQSAAAPVSLKPQPSPSPSTSPLGTGKTAALLSKPPSRETARWKRTQSDQPLKPNRDVTPEPESREEEPVAKPRQARGVLMCGEVLPIQKRNGTSGSAAVWVQEKQGAIIWVLEEIAEDVAYITVDETGCVFKSAGEIEAIWGMDRLRRGMDIKRLIPGIPRLKETNTGALDYDKIADLRRFAVRTANDISVPVTIDLLSGESTIRVSSFPHIAGMMVVSASTLRITSSNGPISEALFGRVPNGLPVTEIIPGFDKMLQLLVEEDRVQIVEGMVVPEQNFRRAKADLAMREGIADAAGMFSQSSGLPAIHRDGSQIMIDIQMRVVKNDALGQSMDDTIAEEVATRPDFYQYKPRSGVLYALWVTYSRLQHAMIHGTTTYAPAISRPPSPPRQPKPVAGVVHNHVEDSSESEDEKRAARRPDTASSIKTQESLDVPSPVTSTTPGNGLPRKKLISDFTILEDMGAGAYGQVKLARQKSADGSSLGSPADAATERIHYSPVVIKYVTKARILVDTWTRDRRLGTVPLEIHVLDYLRRDGYRHPNIVEMSDFFEDKINYYIEMVPHGIGGGMDLFDYIEFKVNMEEHECRRIFAQVASAIEFLHTKCKVVHRDIKDENVILDGEGRVKVIDFGSASYIKNGPFDVFVGTIGMSCRLLPHSPFTSLHHHF